jgi:hypothetical protein
MNYYIEGKKAFYKEDYKRPIGMDKITFNKGYKDAETEYIAHINKIFIKSFRKLLKEYQIDYRPGCGCCYEGLDDKNGNCLKEFF